MVCPADIEGAAALAPGANLRLVPNVVDVAAIEPVPPRRRRAHRPLRRRLLLRAQPRGARLPARAGDAAPLGDRGRRGAGRRRQGQRGDRGARPAGAGAASSPTCASSTWRPAARGAAARGRRLAAEVHRGARLRAAGGRHAARRRRPGRRRGRHYLEGGADGLRRGAGTRSTRPRATRWPPPGASWPRASTRSRRWRGGWPNEDRLGDDRRHPGRSRVRRRAAARRAGRTRPRGGAADRVTRTSAAGTRGRGSPRGAGAEARRSRTWPRLSRSAGRWCCAGSRRELEREAPFDVLLLHYKKEQLLAPRLPPELRRRVAWAEWGPVPPPMRGGVPGAGSTSAPRARSAVVLAISEGTRQSLIDAGIPAERRSASSPTRSTPTSIRFSEAGPPRAYRRELGIPADAFMVGCLSRFHPKKRNDVVDRRRGAARRARAAHLILAGDGETEAELRARAAALARQRHFLPTPGTELAELLSAFDVVVFCPSPTEGEPRAVILGMLAERPCRLDRRRGRGRPDRSPATGRSSRPRTTPRRWRAVLRRLRGRPGAGAARGRAGGEAGGRTLRPHRRRRAGRATAAGRAGGEAVRRKRGQPDEERPLRLLVIDEGVLGHRTLKAQLEARLAEIPGIEATMATVPAPSRLGRLFVRKWSRGSDIDLQALRWRLRWSWQARRLLKRHRRKVDVALVNTQASALLAKGPMRRLPTVLSIDATAGQFTALEYTPHDRWTRPPAEADRAPGAPGDPQRRGGDALDRVERRGAESRIRRAEDCKVGDDPSWPRRRLVGRRRRERPREREGPMRVLFVGNDVERKGLGTLIEAVAALGGEAVARRGQRRRDRGARVLHRPPRRHRRQRAAARASTPRPTSSPFRPAPTRCPGRCWRRWPPGCRWSPRRSARSREMLGDGGETVPPGDPEALAAALRRPGRPASDAGRLGEAAPANGSTRTTTTPCRRRRSSPCAKTRGRGPRDRRPRTAAPHLHRPRHRRRRRSLSPPPTPPWSPTTSSSSWSPPQLGIDTELARAAAGSGRGSSTATPSTTPTPPPSPSPSRPGGDGDAGSARRKAVDGLLEPMLSAPASNLAYALTGTDPAAPPAPAWCGAREDGRGGPRRRRLRRLRPAGLLAAAAGAGCG